jgi:hypothetical protein
MTTTVLKMTIATGFNKTEAICLPAGTYSPFACGGSWDNEISWTVEGYGITGGADDTCKPDKGSFTVLPDGTTASPTIATTSAPTQTPITNPTMAPTVYPTVVATEVPTGGDSGGECCCTNKLNDLLANQVTMLSSLSTSSSAASSDNTDTEDQSSSSSGPQLTLESTTVILGSILCATLFSSALAVALFFRKKVATLEAVLGRGSPLGSLEMGPY